MNKLKAIEYFRASCEAGSFAQAAQRLEVSVPAVQKMVSALEESLGFALLERGARGVRPTPAGSDYLDRCRTLLLELDELTQAERALRGASERANGTLAIAAHPQLAHQVLLPAMPRFHAMHPEVDIDFRTVNRISDADAQTADVLLLHGWPSVPPDFVHRQINGGSSLIMASPKYWASYGVPRYPTDLAQHTCLPMRNPAGIVLDLWEFKRGDDMIQVPVRGWFTSNAREAVLDLVLAGYGVGRFTELTTRQHVQSGRLIPVLLEWEVLGGPPVNLLYRGSARQTLRVRAFIDFAMQCLRDLEPTDRPPKASPSTDLPAWHLHGYGRASATLRPKRRQAEPR